MNLPLLIARGIVCHRRRHAGLAAGAAVATAVIAASLLAGDSVRFTLRALARGRIGAARYALDAGERPFRAALAADLARATGLRAAPALRAPGVAVTADAGRRANRVDVYGVDARWDALRPPAGAAPGFSFGALGPDDAALSANLARRLDLRPGDGFVLRVPRLHAAPAETPLVRRGRDAVALRLRVAAVLADADLGRFGLRAVPAPPLNVFVRLDALARRIDAPDRANLVLFAEPAPPGAAPPLARVADAVRSARTLDDLGLELARVGATGEWELRSSQVFLDDATAAAARAADPAARPLFSYFVNDLRAGDRSTPYSFVAAPGEPIAPPDLADDEIVINDWLAADLGIGDGAALAMRYYVVGPYRRLEEREASFRVRAVVPVSAAGPDLAPDIPGLSDTDRCADWDPRMPVEMSRIREADEQYWNDHRSTPKAFVSLATAQRLWSNRYGRLTAMRFPAGAGGGGALAAGIVQGLDPSAAGWSIRDVAAEADRSASPATDFGPLMLSLAAFLIGAAMLLAALVFRFGIEERAEECGLLRALGFTSRAVKAILLGEALAPALAGVAAGALLGLAGHRLILRALHGAWAGAIGGAAIEGRVRAATLAAAALAGLAAIAASLALAIARQRVRAIRERPGGEADGLGALRRSRVPYGVLGAACIVAAAGPIALAAAGRGPAAAMFFGAGALLLAGGLLAARGLLGRLARRRGSDAPGAAALGPRNIVRRPGRSLAGAAMLACGVFLVVAVGANRRDPRAGAADRSSGTGGYALYGESSLPILHDLATREGQEAAGLDPDALEGVGFALLRATDGDDASCLNLGEVARPRLLGVPSDAFARRGAFAFARAPKVAGGASPWSALREPAGGGGAVVPGIADQTVITWSLKKGIGDTVAYDGKGGRPFEVRLAGGTAPSIFQGSILIDEAAFSRLFPASTGARVVLVEAPAERAEDVRRMLSGALADAGLDLVPAADRLAAFGDVERTYLAIFLLLGGLGLLLGSAGLGVVVARNLLERRRELALLAALGFERRRIIALVIGEHAILLLGGLLLGALAALPAVAPALAQRRVPVGSLLLGLAILAANGAAWIAGAAAWATRGRLLAALQEE